MMAPRGTSLGGTWLLIVAFAASIGGALTSAQEPVRVGAAGVVQPRLIKSVLPVYPPIAVSARVSGRVIVDATIGASGRVADVRITRSIPLLDQAAADAIRQWEFAVPVVDARPVTVVTTVVVNFRIDDSGGTVVLVPPMPPDVPADFAFSYQLSCGGNGFLIASAKDIFVMSGQPPMRLRLNGDDVATVYRELLAIGFFANRDGLATWPEPVPSGIVVRDDDIEVNVTSLPSFVSVTNSHGSGRAGALHTLNIRAQGVWRSALRGGDRESVPPEFEKVKALILSSVEKTDAWKTLATSSVERAEAWRKYLRSCG